jgi:ketosteroid isomerase-like protein
MSLCQGDRGWRKHAMHERDKDEIRYHIDAFLSACIHKDWAAVGRGRVPDWCGFSIRTGTILRGSSELVSEVQAILASCDLVGYEMIEIAYGFYGTTCLVPYVVRLHGSCRAGRLLEIKLHILDVYVNQGGDWLQVASSISLHPESMAHSQLVALLLGLPESAPLATSL